MLVNEQPRGSLGSSSGCVVNSKSIRARPLAWQIEPEAAAAVLDAVQLARGKAGQAGQNRGGMPRRGERRGGGRRGRKVQNGIFRVLSLCYGFEAAANLGLALPDQATLSSSSLFGPLLFAQNGIPWVSPGLAQPDPPGPGRVGPTHSTGYNPSTPPTAVAGSFLRDTLPCSVNAVSATATRIPARFIRQTRHEREASSEFAAFDHEPALRQKPFELRCALALRSRPRIRGGRGPDRLTVRACYIRAGGRTDQTSRLGDWTRPATGLYRLQPSTTTTATRCGRSQRPAPSLKSSGLSSSIQMGTGRQ